MHLVMKIIYFGNGPLIVDTWTMLMWILSQYAISVYINIKMKFNFSINYFQEAHAVEYFFLFYISLRKR